MAMDTVVLMPEKRRLSGKPNAQSRMGSGYAAAGRDTLKRKNIDLPSDAWKKLSIMAAAQGKSLKAFVESLLMAKAKALTLEVVAPESPVSAKSRPYANANPSPSGDWYFEDAGNAQEVEKRAKAYRQGKSKNTVVLRSAEEIADFLKNL